MSQFAGAAEGGSDDKKKEKICDFYLTPRGCIKGEKCDFQHPLSPAGSQTNRVCDFYLTPRGCRKGDQCDFLHPQPKQPVKDKVCTYYMTPQGCIKGLNCDFLHPRPGMFGDVPGMSALPGLQGMGGLPGGGQVAGGVAPAAGGGGGGGRGTRKPCDFFLSPRGCVKGEQCDFPHIRPGASFPDAAALGGFPGLSPFPFGMLPQVGGGGRGAKKALRPKLCEFVNTPRGCVKGDACDFIHQKNKVCDYYLKPQGCRKGALCDFLHPAKDGEAPRPEEDKGSGKIKTQKAGSRFQPY